MTLLAPVGLSPLQMAALVRPLRQDPGFLDQGVQRG
jgi:hypothetical protein